MSETEFPTFDDIATEAFQISINLARQYKSTPPFPKLSIECGQDYADARQVGCGRTLEVTLDQVFGKPVGPKMMEQTVPVFRCPHCGTLTYIPAQVLPMNFSLPTQTQNIERREQELQSEILSLYLDDPVKLAALKEEFKLE